MQKSNIKRQMSVVNRQMFSGGYIAITSAIIISAVISTIALSVSLSGYSNRVNIADTYYKEISLFLAESCVNEAMLKYSQDLLYEGSEIISVGDEECEILQIETILDVPPKKIIYTSAIFNEAATYLKVVIDSVLLHVISWEELETI